MSALQDMLNRLGSTNHDCRQDGADISADFRSDYVFNSRIAGIEESDLVLLVGTNPRMEAPIINARLRKSWLQYGTQVASVGPVADLTFPVTQLGNDRCVFFAALCVRYSDWEHA
jgi:NADH-quinone oxidoreductase subunit G